MPNNYKCVERRFMGLKKKLDRDETLKKEYEAFMEDLFTRGHAELVPKGPKAEGEVWYIPHFSVRHPKKNKLRVVFDCSAKYCETSLNGKLLQGPDLINSLVGILCRFRAKTNRSCM